MSEYWQSSLIRLRAMEPGDAEHFYQINRERDVDRNLEMVWPPTSMASQESWVADAAKKGFGENLEFKFMIEELASGELVGSIDTHHCNQRQGTFEYGLALLEQYRNKGYASEAILLVLRYYFLELRFRKAEPGVFAFNSASLRLHEKLGFVHEGVRRKHGYSLGEFHDLHLFGMTVEEFRTLHPEYANF